LRLPGSVAAQCLIGREQAIHFFSASSFSEWIWMLGERESGLDFKELKT
jgi:hypothetical protein